MNCSELQLRIPELIDGSISGDERRNLEAHIAACPLCKEEFSSLAALFESLKTDQPWSPPATYWNNLLPRIYERIERRSPLANINFAWLMRGAAIAGGVLLVTLAVNIVPTNLDERSLDMQSIASQVPLDEIQDYASRQSIYGIADTADPNSDAIALTADDKSTIQELMGEEGLSVDDNEALESAAGLNENTENKLVAKLDAGIKFN